jgi:hypothetical protein
LVVGDDDAYVENDVDAYIENDAVVDNDAKGEADYIIMYADDDYVDLNGPNDYQN